MCVCICIEFHFSMNILKSTHMSSFYRFMLCTMFCNFALLNNLNLISLLISKQRAIPFSKLSTTFHYIDITLFIHPISH